MKHLILHDDLDTYMVYYLQKNKAKMYQIIFRSQQEYWENRPIRNEIGIYVLEYVIMRLKNNGFKIVDITQEIKNKIDVYSDMDLDYFTYKGCKIFELQSGYGFTNKHLCYVTCKTIEEAIKIIDEEESL